MSLTRKKLKAFGLTEEQVESVIEEHIETVKALQDDVTKYKADADKLPDVQKELDDLKKSGGDDYKKKYEDEHSAFESYKSDISAKETKAAKERAFREILKAAKVSEKRIDTVVKASASVIDKIELDENGNAKNSDTLKADAEKEWSDFIITETHRGADVGKPPAGAGNAKSKEEILKIKDPKERQTAIAENITLFQKG